MTSTFFQTRDQHFTLLANTARDHINWMDRFGYKTEPKWFSRQCDYLHQLMHHGEHVPEY